MTEERLLKRNEVENMVGMKKTKLYHEIKKGRFPQPIRRSQRDVVWVKSEVQEYILNLIA